jgi:hypothetical protein
MKQKTVLITSLLLVISIFMSTTVYATNLGTLSYWYSDANSIARWSSVPITWSADSNGFNSMDFLGYVNHARGEWRNAGIAINSTGDYYASNLKIRGGTYDIMHNYEPSITTTNTGLSVASMVSEGTWTYGSTSENGYNVVDVITYIIYQPNGTNPTQAQYEKTVTHEMGHGLGWNGHSTSSADVMYGTTSSVNALTSQDKNHLTQIY